MVKVFLSSHSRGAFEELYLQIEILWRSLSKRTKEKKKNRIQKKCLMQSRNQSLHRWKRAQEVPVGTCARRDRRGPLELCASPHKGGDG